MSIRMRGLNGGLHFSGPSVAIGTGLRVRPPPSLLRGLQAPSDSLSPSDGAAYLRFDVILNNPMPRPPASHPLAQAG